MREIETDYLVIGAGASGMAFTDTLLTETDADVVLVDRRHGPGGHWLDAYPFVRLHQPSAYYGVNSRPLGQDRIDTTGPNAGFYERATATEICAYFDHVLHDDLVPSGRVRFLGMTDYQGLDGDGHHLRSLLTGEPTTVRVRRKFVDATYVESSIPSRHTPSFTVDPGVRLIPPNDLVHLDEPAATFVVLGAGKTAMDTCNWLLDAGVAPDSIEWFRPRDPWLFNRAAMQPLDHIGAYMHMQACWVEAAAHAPDAFEFARMLEAQDIFLRIDPTTEPLAFRGATISAGELASLRSVERVVRGRIRHIGTQRVETDLGDIPAGAGRVYVDCTAAGVRPTPVRPVFEPDRITLEYVTIGVVPWSAANVAVVEARGADDGAKNALCPPVGFTGNTADILGLAYNGMVGLIARTSDPELGVWAESSRLNPARGAADHMDDPRVPAALTSIGTNLGGAMANLQRSVEVPAPAR